MFLKLNNGLAYVNGKKLLGTCEEITLPEVKNKMITQKALGHIAEVELPGGLEKLEAKMKITAPDPAVLLMIANPSKTVQVQVRGSLEKWGADGVEEEVPVVAMIRAFFKNVPGGAIKQNENAAIELQMSCNYYKLTCKGLIYEIDTINNIYIAAGDDVIANLKANIGF